MHARGDYCRYSCCVLEHQQCIEPTLVIYFDVTLPVKQPTMYRTRPEHTDGSHHIKKNKMQPIRSCLRPSAGVSTAGERERGDHDFFFARSGFNRKDPRLHRTGLPVYQTRYDLCIYCIGTPSNLTLLMLLQRARLGLKTSGTMRVL